MLQNYVYYKILFCIKMINKISIIMTFIVKN